jgi:hypothetical protein
MTTIADRALPAVDLDSCSVRPTAGKLMTVPIRLAPAPDVQTRNSSARLI